MRRLMWLFLLVVFVVAALPVNTPAVAGPKPAASKIKIVKPGEFFCPTSNLVVGNVTLQAGKCYTIFVIRTKAGTFLAFGPPERPPIPPGQTVRLETPAGKKVKGRIFATVPLQATTAVSVNTVTVVGARVEDFGTKVVFTVTGLPATNLTINFQVKL